jgi:hypothetical protein
MDPTTLLLLGGVLVLLLYTRSVMKKALQKKTSLKPAPDKELNLRLTGREMLDKLLVDIQEVSREWIGKLDSRIRMVNQVVIDADLKKKELEEAIKRAMDVLKSFPSKTEGIHPLHQQVFECADQGMDINQICKVTGLEKGEVEMILGLRNLRDFKK